MALKDDNGLRSPIGDCDVIGLRGVDVVSASGTPYTAKNFYQIATGGPVVYSPRTITSTDTDPILVVKCPRLEAPVVAATTGDYSIGDPVYFDPADSTKLTTEASGTQLVGYVVESAEVGATKVLINFDGTLDILTEKGG